MRTLFATEPFGKYEVGTVPGRMPGGGCPHCGGRHLGQESVFALTDYLERIQGIADQKLRDELKAKYEECQKATDTDKLKCFGELAARLASALQQEGKPAETVPTGPPLPRSQPEAAFPIVPVAIGGLVVAGLVAYLATRGG